MIDEFKKEFAFLSNFYYCSISFNGKCYPTVEHAFQAAKTLDTEKHEEIRMANTPAAAKKLGREIALRPEWEHLKVGIMRALIQDKFHSHEDLRNKLIATGNKYLEEGNYWHDNFWGNCKCKQCSNIIGKNMLGELLMAERSYQSGKHYLLNGSEGGVFCKQCGGIYGLDLMEECCGRMVTGEELKGIQQGNLVYKNKRWFKPIQIVHCKKSRYDVLIDRTTKWGNKFELEDPKDDEQRKKVVLEYANWVVNQPELMNSLHELEGKILGCWCAPRLCHGHVLKYLIEGEGKFKELLDGKI